MLRMDKYMPRLGHSALVRVKLSIVWSPLPRIYREYAHTWLQKPG